MIVSVSQHDRQHTLDERVYVCVLDIWLFIQVDLEKDRVTVGFKGAEVVLFVWVVGVTEVVIDGDSLDDARNCFGAQGRQRPPSLRRYRL